MRFIKVFAILSIFVLFIIMEDLYQYTTHAVYRS